MLTRRPSTIPTIIPLTSRRPQARTLDTVFWILCFALHVYHWWFCSSERKQRKHASWNRCKAERETKEKVQWPALQSRCQGKVDGTVLRSHSLQTQREFFSDERDLREHLERRAQKAILGENSVQRKLYSTEYDMEIQNLERRNSEYALFESQRELESQRLQSLQDIQWTDQAQRERIHLCSESEDEEPSSPGNATQEVAKKLKNWKDVAIKRKTLKNSEDWEIFTQPDQESRTASRLRDQVRRLPELLVYIEDSKTFYDLDSPSSYASACVPHQALITSSSRKPSRDIGMLRNTREDMNIPGNVFECQHARRDPDELHDDSRKLSTTSAILRTEGIEKSGSEEPLQSIPMSLLFEKSKTKSLDGGKCPVSMTNHTRGYWDLYSRHGNSELSLLGDASAKIPWPNEIFRTGSWISEQKFAQRRRISRSSVEPWRKERCNILTPSGRLKNVFSGRQLGLVQEETLNSFPHTHATGLRETMWKEVGDARKAHLEQASSSVPKVKWQTDVKKIKV